jgi:anti-sigma factor RsiW
MTDLENRLTAALYRATCPDTSELGEYHLGMLSGPQAAIVEQHLDECPYCSREVAQLDAFMEQVKPDLAYSTAERIKIWIARLVPDVQAGPGSPAPAFAMRGVAEDEAGDRSLVFEAGEVQLMIEIQDEPGDTGRKAIIGLVIGIDPAGAEARLWQEGQPVATTAVDDLGNFSFSNLDSGHYELILAGAETEIHVQELLT